MSLADFIVQVVVSRRHLESTGAEFGINGLVRDYGNFFVGKWYFSFLANKFLIPAVIRVYRDRHVCENGFRSSGSNSDGAVVYVVKGSLGFMTLHFKVGESGL